MASVNAFLALGRWSVISIVGVGTGCVSTTVCTEIRRVGELETQDFVGLKRKVSGIQFAENEKGRDSEYDLTWRGSGNV
jgi:hypothetical protein